MKAIICALLLITTPAMADVFKTVTPDGEVIYSDVKTSGSKQLNVPKPQTYTPPPIPVTPVAQAQQPGEEEAEEEALYKSLVIDSPVNEETIRDNLGNIEVLITSEPNLIRSSGHRYVYLLDGERHGRQTVDNRKVFTNIDRGEHQLAVAIVDSSDNVIIETKPVTVFLHRASIFHPGHSENPNNGTVTNPSN